MLLPVFWFARPGPCSGPGQDDDGRGCSVRSVRGPGPLLVAMACLLLGAGAAVGLALKPVPDGVMALDLPATIGDWLRGPAWEDDSAPAYPTAYRDAGYWYSRGDVRAGLYLADYPVQRQNEEVVYYANRPEGGSARVIAESDGRALLRDGSAVEFTELVVEGSDGRRRVIWYGYIVAGLPVAGAVAAKAYQVVGALHARWDAQVWVFSAACTSKDCESGRGMLESLFGHAYPTLPGLVTGDARHRASGAVNMELSR